MMLTRCPACGTTFRVSPEQLKARAGKVRCGQCQSQFNALDTLVEENILPASLSSAHEAVVEPLVETQAENAEAPAAWETSETPHAAEALADIDDEAKVLAVAEVAEYSDESELNDVAAPSEVEVQDPSALEEPYDTTFEAVPDGEVKTVQRRWPWAIGIGIALLGLAAQVAFHFRVELAVLQPSLKPTMIAACETLGCQVSLPQHAEFLGIETSDLHPDPLQKGHLVLAATLRNHAPFTQEIPAIELTLNDVADRTLIVKDLNPRDYLPKEINAGKGFASNGELAVNLTLDVGDVPAAGYRIYLFYP